MSINITIAVCVSSSRTRTFYSELPEQDNKYEAKGLCHTYSKMKTTSDLVITL